MTGADCWRRMGDALRVTFGDHVALPVILGVGEAAVPSAESDLAESVVLTIFLRAQEWAVVVAEPHQEMAADLHGVVVASVDLGLGRNAHSPKETTGEAHLAN